MMNKKSGKIFADYFVAFDNLDKYVKESLEQQHFVEAIILIHTTIEIYLASLLDCLLDQDKRKIVRNYRYIQLAKTCYLLDLIDKATYQELREINGVRNSFAHQKIGFDITEEQIGEKCERWLKLSKKILDISVKMHEEKQRESK